jgi:modification methylase
MKNGTKRKGSATNSFGTSKREAHDSSRFYKRSLYDAASQTSPAQVIPSEDAAPLGEWVDQIYCQSSENMPLPDRSVALAFTSPPYNVGKDYDDNISLSDYLDLIERVGKEVYRVLVPGGRYVINIANLGRKPYIPLHSYFYKVHMEIGFLPMGEIIWRKSKGANNSCAWGSFQSARSPRLRDLHEYLLVFAKQCYTRPSKGESDISQEEFMASTLSIWDIPPESARKIGHPAPFPLALAERVIHLYSFKNDVILDPFAGSGTTCIAALHNHRHYVGFDISPEYCELCAQRLKQQIAPPSSQPLFNAGSPANAVPTPPTISNAK